ncbi:MAG: hypothetical protein JNJ57_07560 [Saprospiraceae bacterium]|nr:hypothetical protein [Saprospiraceae bacterium]
MRYLPLLLLCCQWHFSLAQDFPSEVSIQYGPETGISGIMPKLAYRTPSEGWYFGGFFSIWLMESFSISVGVVGGYRYRGSALETSLSLTRIDFANYNESKKFRGTWLTVNPRVMLGQNVYAGFGPGFYLLRPKKETGTLWDDVGKWNFELGYSELLRW